MKLGEVFGVMLGTKWYDRRSHDAISKEDPPSPRLHTLQKFGRVT